MVNILIVDDEHIERKALKQILERNMTGICIVGEAENGRKAIHLAQELQPDLVMMDIQMPGTDGLAAIREIRALQPQMQFIIVSAYDTFEYARQALRMDVSDYLLKPSKTDTIVETVQHVVKRIEQQKFEQEMRSREKLQLQKLAPIVEADLVTQLLFDHVHDIHLAEMMHCFGIESFQRAFVLVVFLIPKKAEEEESRCQTEATYRKVRQLFSQQETGWVGAMSGKQIPIIVCSDPGASYRSQVSSLVRKIINLCSRSDSAFDCFIGVGGEYETLEEVAKSYREAMLASIDLTLPSRHCLHEDWADRRQQDSAAALQMEEQILEQLRRGNGDEVMHLMGALIDHYEAAGASIAETQQKVLGITLLLARVLAEMGVQLETPYFSLQAGHYSQLKMEARLCIGQLMKPVAKMKTTMTPDLFQSLKQYIITNSHKNITLETTAAYVKLSPYYVSKLFKEQSGTNYIDFLTECRVRNAKKLMADPEKSLKEIALDVGFQDPNYFSRVFKRSCDQSPTDYRRALLSNR
ncbi:response regulator [Paenibacillaceae bacterium]|nr:response regulator [Paenibacillaceae bacterium]